MLQAYDKNNSHLRDFNECVALMRGGSKTFFAASKLLPKRVRQASIALYAFCRVADDLVDNSSRPEESLKELQLRLDCIYDQRPMDFIEDHALSHVVHQFKMPRALLDALLEGFAWDAKSHRYQTIEDVHAYGARVAGSVGAMMSWMMGARKSSTLARACELGVAMQLTNIARDVGEDARNGRLYLPRDWLIAEGIDPDEWLKNPRLTTGIQNVVKKLLLEADRLYVQSSVGVADLATDCRAAIFAARLIYAEIGEYIKKNNHDSVNHRGVVPYRRKIWLLCQAKVQSHMIFSPKNKKPALQAIAYLVNACQVHCEEHGLRPEGFPNRGFPDRIEWVLELIERRLNEERQFSQNYKSQMSDNLHNIH